MSAPVVAHPVSWIEPGHTFRKDGVAVDYVVVHVEARALNPHVVLRPADGFGSPVGACAAELAGAAWRRVEGSVVGPRAGEDGSILTACACDSFRAYGPVPGRCWCGWDRPSHYGLERVWLVQRMDTGAFLRLGNEWVDDPSEGRLFSTSVDAEEQARRWPVRTRCVECLNFFGERGHRSDRLFSDSE